MMFCKIIKLILNVPRGTLKPLLCKEDSTTRGNVIEDDKRVTKVSSQRDDGGIVIKSAGSTIPTSRRRIPFLRCPKYSAAYRLEYFDRGAKPLLAVSSTGRASRALFHVEQKNKKTPWGGLLCFFRGMCLLAKRFGFFLYNCRCGCEAHRSSAKIYNAVFPLFLKAFAFGTATV